METVGKSVVSFSFNVISMHPLEKPKTNLIAHHVTVFLFSVSHSDFLLYILQFYYISL